MKKILLFAALLASLTLNSFAQEGEVLVGGNPPLTRADFQSVVEYYERGLDIEFSSADLDELRSIIVENWRKGQKSNPRSLTKWLATVSKINGIGGAKREEIKDEIRDAVLGDLRASAESDLSLLVLGVYEKFGANAARTEDENAFETTPTENADSEKENTETGERFQPVAVKLSDLTGKWVKGTVASYGYRNSVTNDYRSGYGAANQHDIYAGGNFDYSNFAQVSGYGCTTELFTSMKGRASVSGSRVTFNYVSGTVKVEDKCKKSIVTRKAQIEPVTYQIERGSGDTLRMCEIGKEDPICLYKVKE